MPGCFRLLKEGLLSKYFLQNLSLVNNTLNFFSIGSFCTVNFGCIGVYISCCDDMIANESFMGIFTTTKKIKLLMT
jgi:hypothetical protein